MTLFLWLLACASNVLSINSKTVEEICVKGISESSMNGIYIYNSIKDNPNTTEDETDTFWQYGPSTFDTYRLSYVDDTWMLHATLVRAYADPDQTNSIIYCSNTSTDLVDNITDNPSNCFTWMRNQDYFYDIPINNVSVTSNLTVCEEATVFDPDLDDIASALSDVVLTFTLLDQLVYGIIFCVLTALLTCVACHRCTAKNYPANRLKTYNHILMAKGYDPLATRTKTDKRPIGQVILKRDIMMGKVVWHNDYRKDFITYLRMNHTFLSLFFGHDLDPYGQRDRIFTLFGAKIVAIGSTWAGTALLWSLISNNEDASEVFSYRGLNWEVLLIRLFTSFQVVLASNLIKVGTKCSCVEYCCACYRRFVKFLGKGSMGLVFLLGCIWCALCFTIFSQVAIESDADITNMAAFFIDYFIGVILAWFTLEILIKLIKFHIRRNTQLYGHNYKTLKCKIACVFCCFPCYCVCCPETDERIPMNKEAVYLGTRSGEFGLNWTEFQAYWRVYSKLRAKGKVSDKQLLENLDLTATRKLDNVLDKIGSDAETLELGVGSVSFLSAQNSASVSSKK